MGNCVLAGAARLDSINCRNKGGVHYFVIPSKRSDEESLRTINIY